MIRRFEQHIAVRRKIQRCLEREERCEEGCYPGVAPCLRDPGVWAPRGVTDCWGSVLVGLSPSLFT